MPVLRHYHAHLLQRGVENYAWEQLGDDYRLCVAMGLYIATEYCRGEGGARLVQHCRRWPGNKSTSPIAILETSRVCFARLVRFSAHENPPLLFRHARRYSTFLGAGRWPATCRASGHPGDLL